MDTAVEGIRSEVRNVEKSTPDQTADQENVNLCKDHNSLLSKSSVPVMDDGGSSIVSTENTVSLRSRKIVSTTASGIPRPSTTIAVSQDLNACQQRRQRPASVGPSATSRLPYALNISSGKKRSTTSGIERSRSDVNNRQQNRMPRTSTSHHRRAYTMPETSIRNSATSPCSDLSSNSSNHTILRSCSAVESNGNGSAHTCAKIVSKIGSLNNVTHKPGGGNVKIFHENQKFDVDSKCGSKDNIKHKPGGGNVRIIDEKIKLDVQAKVASLEKVSHKPGGGDVKIHEEKLQWNTTSRVGSLDNCKHKPGGGNIQIFSEIPAWIKAGGRPNLQQEERDLKYRYSKKSGSSVSTSISSGDRPVWQE